uniref:Peptidoglycan-associated lipoprotein n=1 Tax=uncultured delta proteobacterium TaxID=34034 RepID=Q2YZT8_9DELT|nr:peptidoglycan-associated lipoprotein [uncultured delta proteobacterium]
MKQKLAKFLMVIVLALSISLLFGACTKKEVAVEDPTMTSQNGEQERLKQLEAERAAQAKAETEAMRLAKSEMLEKFKNIDIYFEFDKSSLTEEAKLILKEKALFLSANSAKNTTIEGHCDERGTSEYNLALGDRRAKNVKTYLQGLGISGQRIITTSYGEEMPVDTGHNETAWAKNRRAHFEID